jgi:hypothetical protein
LHFKLGWFTPEAWPFAAAFFILILLVLSSLTIFELMYNFGLFEPKQNIRSVALAMLVAVIAFGVQALFLKIGVDAINQYKIKEPTAMECDVSLEEFEKDCKVIST